MSISRRSRRVDCHFATGSTVLAEWLINNNNESIGGYLIEHQGSGLDGTEKAF